jgi:hypothetical protein
MADPDYRRCRLATSLRARHRPSCAAVGAGGGSGHVTWFVGAVENFRFYDLKVHAFTDPEAAVAEVKAEAIIKPTERIYLQDYVLFLRAAGGLASTIRL